MKENFSLFIVLCLGNWLLVSCINEVLETSFSLLSPGVEVGIAKDITRVFISYLMVHLLNFSHFLLSTYKTLYWSPWLNDCLCPTPMKFARLVRVGVLVLNFLLLMGALSNACCLWRQRMSRVEIKNLWVTHDVCQPWETSLAYWNICCVDCVCWVHFLFAFPFLLAVITLFC